MNEKFSVQCKETYSTWAWKIQGLHNTNEMKRSVYPAYNQLTNEQTAQELIFQSKCK